MKSDKKSVKEYLDNLPIDRKRAISEVRKIILKFLPEGIEERMNWGMISYEIPLSIYPDTYNGQPLMYAALASQKNHMAVYLSGIYSHNELRDKFLTDYRIEGKKMDIGKSCVRFKNVEDLPLNLIGEVISAFNINEFIEIYNNTRKHKSAK